MTEDKCPGCGSSPSDRESSAAEYPGEDIPIHLYRCLHCSAWKCCLCDMGDDVECISCPTEE